MVFEELLILYIFEFQFTFIPIHFFSWFNKVSPLLGSEVLRQEWEGTTPTLWDTLGKTEVMKWNFDQ